MNHLDLKLPFQSVVAMMQWQDQIEMHTQPGTLSTFVFHGAARTDEVEKLKSSDVIITSYSIIEVAFDCMRHLFSRLCTVVLPLVV
jgi:DNA repair protein RAD16